MCLYAECTRTFKVPDVIGALITREAYNQRKRKGEQEKVRVILTATVLVKRLTCKVVF